MSGSAATISAASARLLEGAADADDECHGQQEGGRKVAAAGREGQHRDGNRFGDLRGGCDQPAIVAVRGMASGQE